MSLVTLIRPATVSSTHAYSVPITPPIGVAYLAGSLETAGHQVAIIDALGEAPLQRTETCHPRLRAHGLSIPQVVSRIDPRSQIIGVSAMFSQEWPHTEQLLMAIRERFAETPIILGGEHATAAWKHVLETCSAVSICVLGEGEQTILELADRLTEGDLSGVAGIAFRVQGRPVCTSRRDRILDLDNLPRPAWHLVDLAPYLENGFGHGVNRGRSMPILATRGCPYRCAFCSSPQMWTPRYVFRSPASVLDEIRDYVERYGATNIDFYDLTAITRRDWALEFCRLLDRSGLNITWQLPSGTRSEALDEEVLSWLYRSGCRNITYAPESGSPRMLARIGKRVDLSHMCASLQTARRLGLRTKCNLVIGFPGETRHDVYKTLAFAAKLVLLGVDDIPLYLFSPYPGSKLHDDLQACGAIGTMDGDYFASLGCYMDISQVSHFCGRIGPRELNCYRTLGMAMLYGLNYALRPWSVLRTLKNVLRNCGTTVFEQRLCDAYRRFRAGRALAALPE